MAARLRVAARVAAIVGALAFYLVLHGAWRLVRRPSPWPPRFLGTIGRIAGARVRTVGTPLRRDAFLLANHLSWLDILILAGATGTTFVAKGELAGVPVIGWLCGLNRTVFVARGDRMNVTQQVATIRAALAEGYPITVFPEGTTGDGHTLLPFKASLLAVLDPPPPGIRVQPVTIGYGAATGEIAWVGDEPGLANALKVLARPGRFEATLNFHEPFAPADAPGRKAIAAEARRRMEAGGSAGPAAL